MSGAVPFRLRVLQNLTDILAAISTDDGYNYTLKDRVFRGRLMFGDDDPIPLVSIVEAPLPDDPSYLSPANEFWHGEWELFIQGWVDDDKENPTDPAHYLMADVCKALAEERKQALRRNNLFGMGGRVIDFHIGGKLVRPPEEFVSSYANFMLALKLEIAENMSDPYA